LFFQLNQWSEFRGVLYKAGAVLNLGGTFYGVNSLFAYNYKATGGSGTSPTGYVLDDIIGYTESSDNANIKFYNCIYHATLPGSYPIGTSVSNIHFTGNTSGSDNTIFSGGSLSKLTDENGNEIGDAIYRPFLYNNNGSIAPTLKSGSFVLSNLGTRTRYANNNNSNPVVAYYNGSSYVNLTGTSASGQEVILDQVGAARPDPPARGAIQGTVDNLYMLKVLGASTGTVNGGTLYGDVYPSGTSLNVTAIPNSGYSFTRYDYVLGGTGTASTTNPYTFTVTANTTLQPVFTALAGGSYTINYLGNGNTGGTVPTGGTFSSSTTVAAVGTMVNAGYTFNGWNTNSNGSGTAYAALASYSAGANLALYAQWVWASGSPTISSFNPTTAGTGTTVTITGTGLTAATIVTFGGTTPSSFTVVDANTITAIVASGTSGTISVITPGGTATSFGTFTYQAPVQVYNGAVLQASYQTLKASFDAINAGTHQGEITIKMNSSTTESAAAVLNASSSPSSYTSVNIYPTAPGLTVSGNLAAPLIDLNGADNVTIDGRVNQTGNTDLTISNTNTSTTAGTSTIRFINDASTNTVKYCTIKGSETVINTPSAGSGTLFFSTGTSTGNITNTITDNTITSAGANLPFNAIYSYGTAAKENSGISITNNNIQDYSGASPNGIYLDSNSSAWTITGNRFFQTATRYITGIQRDINIVTAGGGGYVINNNIIGYSSALGTGTSTFTGTANLIPIELTAGTSSASEIQGNTISAISFSTSNTTNVGSGIFSGISVLAGTVNVGTTTANTIGAETDNGAITITPSSGTPFIQGIYATSTGTVGIQNNKIGGISVNGAATIGFTFFGIKTAGTAGNFTISGNTIGSTSTTNSIAVGTNGTTTTGVCGFFGISQAATGTVSITGNTIQNCSAYGTASSTFYGISNTGSTGTTAISTNNILNGTLTGTEKLLGIFNSALPTTLNISTNTISTLATASSLIATGISSAGAATTTTINGNIINTISSTGASCVISGIKSTVGTTVNIYSNTINALSGSGATSPIVNGINIDGGTTVNVYKNNIYNLSQSGAIATTVGAVNGMLISAGTTVYAYNNFISELKAPAANINDAVRGISITSNTVLSTYGVYNNTVYLNASSSGTNFGSSGIFHTASLTATTSALDLRNNIIVNNSTPKGTGSTYAFKRTLGSAGYLANYASTSNNNNFYAGTPGTYNVIYFDGTSSAQTLYAYKTGVFTAGTIAPRDAASITELPPFVNKSISPYDLRISTGSATLCEGRGSVVSTPIAITTDYYGTARYPNTGYPASASYPPSAPDMGAHEFGGTPALGLSGTVNVGTGQTYTSLTNAGGLFEAIYNNGITSNLTALITSDLTSESGAFELMQWTGSSTLTISPTGGAARTISGTVNGAMISLKGADNVTFDGLNSEGNKLTISNLGTSNGGGTSTICFINGATGNTIKNCTVSGSSTSTGGGIIIFFTTTGTTGNNNNTITGNNITNAGGNRPLNAIFSFGSATYTNNTNTISNNWIYDFLNPGADSYGIYINTNTSAWTISGNSFYETTTSFAPTGSFAYNVIYINTGVNFTVSNNYIGGRAASCGGTAWTKTSAQSNAFKAIYLSTPTGGTASSIQGNTIQNFTWPNYGGSGWTGIQTGSSGSVNIGTTAGNTIGSTTGSTSVTYTGGAAGATCYGIDIQSTGTVDCQNNAIGLITAGHSSAIANTNFCGISKTGAGTTTISNNTIGSTTITNSINVTSASTGNAQTVYGINSAGTGAVTISGNTISKLTNGTTNTTVATLGRINGIYVSGGTNTITGNTVRDMTIANANNLTDHTASVGGIVFNYTTAAAQTISANTIYNLSNGYASFAGNVAGLYYNGSTTPSTVSKNFIHSLSVHASSNGANVYGIKIASGATTYSNNIISLGGNTLTTIYGIYETGALSHNNNLYFNTVNIGGTAASGTNNSYALYSAANTNTRDFRNNIFSNARSNAGTPAATGKHYAAYFATNPSAPGLTEDYNDYLASGTGGTFGYFNGADVASLAAWKAATGQDANSLSTTPGFPTPAGTSADYIPSVSLPGITISGITTDYAGATRASTPTMGAYEYSCTPTVGTASSTPTLCINTALTDITHTTTGATGIGSATGLPAGVTAAWATNTITISGTPTASGTFSYSIPLTGGCGSVNATGTIIVGPLPTPVITGSASVASGVTGSVYSVTNAAGHTYVWTVVGGTVTAGDNTNSITLTWGNAGTGTVDVTETIVATGCSAAATQKTVTINLAPTITSFTPSTGPVGTLVTITGTNLSSPTAFTIGGVAAIVVSNDGTSLVGMVMPGATTGAISVTTAGGTATGGSNFTVTATPYPGAQQSMLVGTGNTGAAMQGVSVAVSADGNTAVVGGYADNSYLGAVWIYTRSGTTWTQQTKLVGTGASASTSIYQGYTVAISADGNTVIEGGYGDNSQQGALWVFTRSGSTWSQQGNKLVGTGGSVWARQSGSVALSADGNTAIVGGNYDGATGNEGAAWVFTRSAGTWSQQGSKLVGSGAVGAAYQGNSVAISADGNTAMVGGSSDNSSQGAVWVYTRSAGTWSQQGSKLTGTGNVGTARQGRSVALSADGNTAMVGGHRDNTDQGAVWVYTRSGSTWSQQGSKLVGTGITGASANQGQSVSLSADGNTAIVGGNADDTYQGASWVYSRSGSTWSQQGSKLTDNGSTAASQGQSVSLSADGTTAMVGGYNDNSNQGAAWVFVPGSSCANPTSGGTIAADQTICSGFAPAAFTSSEAASGNTGTLEYKWQVSTTSSSGGFSDISPAVTTETYAPGALSASTWYKRLARVSCMADWTGAVASNVLQITVNQPSFSPGTFTVANLQATGSDIQWYAAASGGTALATSTALVNGTHYYASQTVNSVESTARLDVTATILQTPCLPTAGSPQTPGAGATVAGLTTLSGQNIRWYAGATGGNALPVSTVLSSGTYYATQTVSCTESATRLAVTVTVP